MYLYINTVSTNQTQIDRLKNQHHERAADEFNEVFGTPSELGFKLSWIWPIAVNFPDSVRDRIFGYVIPSSSDSELAPLTARTDSLGNEIFKDR